MLGSALADRPSPVIDQAFSPLSALEAPENRAPTGERNRGGAGGPRRLGGRGAVQPPGTWTVSGRLGGDLRKPPTIRRPALKLSSTKPSPSFGVTMRTHLDQLLFKTPKL